MVVMYRPSPHTDSSLAQSVMGTRQASQRVCDVSSGDKPFSSFLKVERTGYWGESTASRCDLDPGCNLQAQIAWPWLSEMSFMDLKHITEDENLHYGLFLFLIGLVLFAEISSWHVSLTARLSCIRTLMLQNSLF
jgi:hypothetical protein